MNYTHYSFFIISLSLYVKLFYTYTRNRLRIINLPFGYCELSRIYSSSIISTLLRATLNEKRVGGGVAVRTITATVLVCHSVA